jgi:hypothetical protein
VFRTSTSQRDCRIRVEFPVPIPLEELRRASERFRDVRVAEEAEGYVTDGMCVDAAMVGLPPALGGMGIHYMPSALLGITAMQPRVNATGVHTDFLRPAFLLYEPQPDGSFELVGVENLVFRWRAADRSGGWKCGSRIPQ